jgi:hypothetical protein
VLHVICLSIRKSARERLEEALRSVPHRVSFSAGTGGPGASGFDEHRGLAARYRTLEAFLEAIDPSWDPDDPVLLIATSSGAAALRAWLRNEAARERVDAALLIDTGEPSARGIDSGITEFARDCEAEPGEKMLVLVRPQERTGWLSEDIAIALEGGQLRGAARGAGGVRRTTFEGVPASLDELPPLAIHVLSHVMVPFFHDLAPPASTDPLLEHITERRISPALPIGARALAWSQEQLRALPVPSAAVKLRWWLATELAEGSYVPMTPHSGNPAAAAACAAAGACLLPGEKLPHAARPNVSELVWDAARVGAWHSAESVRSRALELAPGDLAVLSRARASRPESEAWGHLWRVLGGPNQAGTIRGIGTSEHSLLTWTEHSFSLSDPALLGFILYPRADRSYPKSELSPAELERLGRYAALMRGKREPAWWDAAG